MLWPRTGPKDGLVGVEGAGLRGTTRSTSRCHAISSFSHDIGKVQSRGDDGGDNLPWHFSFSSLHVYAVNPQSTV